MKLIKSILTIVEEMKRFPGKEIIFSINVIFKKQKTVLFIKFKIQNAVDISNSIIILNNNRLLKFLPLIRQGVSGYVTQKRGMKY